MTEIEDADEYFAYLEALKNDRAFLRRIKRAENAPDLLLGMKETGA